MNKKVSKNGKEKRDLIGRLLKKDTPINWPREMKIANKLFEQHPVDFWNTFILTFELNSLAWLLSNDGEEQIKKQRAYFDLDKRQKEATINIQQN